MIQIRCTYPGCPGTFVIEWPGTEEPKERIGVPEGGKCSSYKPVFVAIEKALSIVWEKYINHPSKPRYGSLQTPSPS